VSDSPILFCPFCREAYEGPLRCPSCDVELVGLRELGELAAATAPDDAPLSVWSPKRGRGALGFGALLTLIAFFCPFATLAGELQVTNSLYTLARGRSLRLWLVPLAAFALLLLLYRRRNGPSMRGARVAAIFLSLIPSAVVSFSLVGAHSAALRMAESYRADVSLQVGLGSWLVWLAALPLLWGSARLGVRRAARVR
jgi:hypothetical protein